MMIGQMQNDDGPKELRVGVALKYHLQLRELKILRGKSMAATGDEALDDYFSNVTPEGDTTSGTAHPTVPFTSPNPRLAGATGGCALLLCPAHDHPS